MKKLAEEKLIIYLADLDHFRPGNCFNVPLGIGSIASYCKSIYGEAIDISLFKDPNELIEEIRKAKRRIETTYINPRLMLERLFIKIDNSSN